MNKVTAIIPVYNTGVFLNELIEQLEQLSGINCIFVDDGSDGKTLSILKTISNENWEVIFNDHRGVSFARNEGISLVKTDFLMFIDSDDSINISGMQFVIDSLYSCNCINFDVISCSNHTENKDINLNNISEKNNLLVNVLAIKNNDAFLPAPWSKVYKVSFLKKNSILFPEEIIMGEDMLFNLKVILKAKKIKFIGKQIYLYKKRDGSITQSKNQNKLSNSIYFDSQMKMLLNKYLSNKDAMKLYQNKIISSWINGIYAEIRNGNRKEMKKINSFFKQKIHFHTYFFNELSVKEKVLELLIILKMYKAIYILSIKS